MFKKILRKVAGIKKSETLNSVALMKRYNELIVSKLFTKKYNTDQIINSLIELGVGKGSNIFIHSSWDSFNNYNGTPEDLLDALIELIGDSGTIAMPAYPLIRKKPFNLKTSVSKAGILSEIFRQYPGVHRSANVRHSVCAKGPLAEILTNTHHMSRIRFDEYSPYYKLCDHKFKIITLGLPTYMMGTIVHCVEATMWKEIPYFRSFYDFNTLIEQKYIGYDGREYSYQEYKDNVVSRNDYFRNQYIIWRYFNKQYIKKCRISNLQIGSTDAFYTYNRLCELAKKNVTIYIYPRYRK